MCRNHINQFSHIVDSTQIETASSDAHENKASFYLPSINPDVVLDYHFSAEFLRTLPRGLTNYIFVEKSFGEKEWVQTCTPGFFYKTKTDDGKPVKFLAQPAMFQNFDYIPRVSADTLFSKKILNPLASGIDRINTDEKARKALANRENISFTQGFPYPVLTFTKFRELISYALTKKDKISCYRISHFSSNSNQIHLVKDIFDVSNTNKGVYLIPTSYTTIGDASVNYTFTIVALKSVFSTKNLNSILALQKAFIQSLAEKITPEFEFLDFKFSIKSNFTEFFNLENQFSFSKILKKELSKNSSITRSDFLPFETLQAVKTHPSTAMAVSLNERKLQVESQYFSVEQSINKYSTQIAQHQQSVNYHLGKITEARNTINALHNEIKKHKKSLKRTQILKEKFNKQLEKLEDLADKQQSQIKDFLESGESRVKNFEDILSKMSIKVHRITIYDKNLKQIRRVTDYQPQDLAQAFVSSDVLIYSVVFSTTKPLPIKCINADSKIVSTRIGGPWYFEAQLCSTNNPTSFAPRIIVSYTTDDKNRVIPALPEIKSHYSCVVPHSQEFSLTKDYSNIFNVATDDICLGQAASSIRTCWKQGNIKALLYSIVSFATSAYVNDVWGKKGYLYPPVTAYPKNLDDYKDYYAENLEKLRSTVYEPEDVESVRLRKSGGITISRIGNALLYETEDLEYPKILFFHTDEDAEEELNLYKNPLFTRILGCEAGRDCDTPVYIQNIAFSNHFEQIKETKIQDKVPQVEIAST